MQGKILLAATSFAGWAAAMTGGCLVPDGTDGAVVTATASSAVAVCTHYVATTGSDASSGTSIASAWRTIQHALSTATAPGTTICVEPGTYEEPYQLSFMASGSATGGYITLMKDPASEGTVTIDGTQGHSAGCNPAIRIENRSYVAVSGLHIINHGNSNYPGCGLCVVGVSVNDSHHVTLSSNVFSEINPTAECQFGIPVLVYAWEADSGTHDISIVANAFLDSDSNSEEVWAGLLAIAGNVHDFEVRDNVFDDADSVAIDTAGNQGGLNLHPERGVFSNNVFEQSGSADLNPVAPGIQGTYALYLQATDQMLVERNYFHACGYGVGVATEPAGGVADPWISSHTWIRDNLFVDTVLTDVAAGVPLGSSYLGVNDVYVTNNTIYRPASTSPSYALFVPSNGTSYLGGNSAFLNNIVFSNAGILYYSPPPGMGIRFDFNLYGTSSAYPVFYNGQSITLGEFRITTGSETSSDEVALGASPFGGPTSSRSGFRLSSFDNAGTLDHEPAWADFGPYAPPELDHYGGPRVTPAAGYEGFVIDRGAAQYCSPYWLCASM